MTRATIWMGLSAVLLFAGCAPDAAEPVVDEVAQVREQMLAIYDQNTSVQNTMMAGHERFKEMVDDMNDPVVDSLVAAHERMLIMHEKVLARHAEFIDIHKNILEQQKDWNREDDLPALRRQHEAMKNDHQLLMRVHEQIKEDYQRFMPIGTAREVHSD